MPLLTKSKHRLSIRTIYLFQFFRLALVISGDRAQFVPLSVQATLFVDKVELKVRTRQAVHTFFVLPSPNQITSNSASLRTLSERTLEKKSSIVCWKTVHFLRREGTFPRLA
jgi:hypothetical protein